MTHKRIVLLVFVICFGSAVGIYSTHSSSQTKQSKQDQQKAKIPIVDLNSEEQATADLVELRRNRSAKYKSIEPIREQKEQNATNRDLPLSHAPVQPAIPIDQSDVIIVATVVDARAVVFQDKSDVYSEFSIRVESIFKNISPLSLAANSEITVDRAGGIVRFASGKTLQRGILGQGFPVPDSKYLLFLKWDEAGKDFPIVTGYCLDGGKVVPLDGDEDLQVYAEYKRLKGKNQQYLLQLLEQSLAGSSTRKVTNK